MISSTLDIESEVLRDLQTEMSSGQRDMEVNTVKRCGLQAETWESEY